jgi:hypothetical protein
MREEAIMKMDLISILIPIVIGNIFTGIIFMIGFVQVVRRSIDKDIPTRLASIDGHIAEIGRELIQMRRTQDKHEYRIESLERADAKHENELNRRRDDDPDDTGVRRRRPTAKL